MKLLYLFSLCVLLAIVSPTISAWEKEDHEIFDLVSAVEAAEGKGTTFYSWLDVSPTASTGGIAKAYRKLSMQLHPDKNPGVKGIHERFARLGVIATILRNPESRKRYDFFYKNGVPKWRGTGYYYSRFRPGLGSVLIFLAILTSGLEYVVRRMNYNRDLKRIEHIIREARLAAWGARLAPLEGERKVKVNLGGPQYDEDGFSVSGRFIEMVVDEKNVYVRNPDGSKELLDSSTATRPRIADTWFLALVKLIAGRIRNRSKTGKETVDGSSMNGSTYPGSEIDDSENESGSTSETPASGLVTPKEGRAPTVKTGGKRKKVPRKR